MKQTETDIATTNYFIVRNNANNTIIRDYVNPTTGETSTVAAIDEEDFFRDNGMTRSTTFFKDAQGNTASVWEPSSGVNREEWIRTTAARNPEWTLGGEGEVPQNYAYQLRRFANPVTGETVDVREDEMDKFRNEVAPLWTNDMGGKDVSHFELHGRRINGVDFDNYQRDWNKLDYAARERDKHGAARYTAMDLVGWGATPEQVLDGEARVRDRLDLATKRLADIGEVDLEEYYNEFKSREYTGEAGNLGVVKGATLDALSEANDSALWAPLATDTLRQMAEAYGGENGEALLNDLSWYGRARLWASISGKGFLTNLPGAIFTRRQFELEAEALGVDVNTLLNQYFKDELKKFRQMDEVLSIRGISATAATTEGVAQMAGLAARSAMDTAALTAAGAYAPLAGAVVGGLVNTAVGIERDIQQADVMELDPLTGELVKVANGRSEAGAWLAAGAKNIGSNLIEAYGGKLAKLALAKTFGKVATKVTTRLLSEPMRRVLGLSTGLVDDASLGLFGKLIHRSRLFTNRIGASRWFKTVDQYTHIRNTLNPVGFMEEMLEEMEDAAFKEAFNLDRTRVNVELGELEGASLMAGAKAVTDVLDAAPQFAGQMAIFSLAMGALGGTISAINSQTASRANLRGALRQAGYSNAQIRAMNLEQANEAFRTYYLKGSQELREEVFNELMDGNSEVGTDEIVSDAMRYVGTDNVTVAVDGTGNTTISLADGQVLSGVDARRWAATILADQAGRNGRISLQLDKNFAQIAQASLFVRRADVRRALRTIRSMDMDARLGSLANEDFDALSQAVAMRWLATTSDYRDSVAMSQLLMNQAAELESYAFASRNWLDEKVTSGGAKGLDLALMRDYKFFTNASELFNSKHPTSNRGVPLFTATNFNSFAQNNEDGSPAEYDMVKEGVHLRRNVAEDGSVSYTVWFESVTNRSNKIEVGKEGAVDITPNLPGIKRGGERGFVTLTDAVTYANELDARALDMEARRKAITQDLIKVYEREGGRDSDSLRIMGNPLEDLAIAEEIYAGVVTNNTDANGEVDWETVSKSMSQVQGYTDADGVVYIFLDNMPSMFTAVQTLVHELTHRGRANTTTFYGPSAPTADGLVSPGSLRRHIQNKEMVGFFERLLVGHETLRDRMGRPISVESYNTLDIVEKAVCLEETLAYLAQGFDFDRTAKSKFFDRIMTGDKTEAFFGDSVILPQNLYGTLTEKERKNELAAWLNTFIHSGVHTPTVQDLRELSQPNIGRNASGLHNLYYTKWGRDVGTAVVDAFHEAGTAILGNAEFDIVQLAHDLVGSVLSEEAIQASLLANAKDVAKNADLSNLYVALTGDTLSQETIAAYGEYKTSTSRVAYVYQALGNAIESLQWLEHDIDLDDRSKITKAAIREQVANLDPDEADAVLYPMIAKTSKDVQLLRNRVKSLALGEKHRAALKLKTEEANLAALLSVRDEIDANTKVAQAAKAGRQIEETYRSDRDTSEVDAKTAAYQKQEAASREQERKARVADKAKAIKDFENREYIQLGESNYLEVRDATSGDKRIVLRAFKRLLDEARAKEKAAMDSGRSSFLESLNNLALAKAIKDSEAESAELQVGQREAQEVMDAADKAKEDAYVESLRAMVNDYARGRELSAAYDAIFKILTQEENAEAARIELEKWKTLEAFTRGKRGAAVKAERVKEAQMNEMWEARAEQNDEALKAYEAALGEAILLAEQQAQQQAQRDKAKTQKKTDSEIAQWEKSRKKEYAERKALAERIAKAKAAQDEMMTRIEAEAKEAEANGKAAGEKEEQQPEAAIVVTQEQAEVSAAAALRRIQSRSKKDAFDSVTEWKQHLELFKEAIKNDAEGVGTLGAFDEQQTFALLALTKGGATDKLSVQEVRALIKGSGLDDSTFVRSLGELYDACVNAGVFVEEGEQVLDSSDHYASLVRGDGLLGESDFEEKEEDRQQKEEAERDYDQRIANKKRLARETEEKQKEAFVALVSSGLRKYGVSDEVSRDTDKFATLIAGFTYRNIPSFVEKMGIRFPGLTSEETGKLIASAARVHDETLKNRERDGRREISEYADLVDKIFQAVKDGNVSPEAAELFKLSEVAAEQEFEAKLPEELAAALSALSDNNVLQRFEKDTKRSAKLLVEEYSKYIPTEVLDSQLFNRSREKIVEKYKKLLDDAKHEREKKAHSKQNTGAASVKIVSRLRAYLEAFAKKQAVEEDNKFNFGGKTISKIIDDFLGDMNKAKSIFNPGELRLVNSNNGAAKRYGVNSFGNIDMARRLDAHHGDTVLMDNLSKASAMYKRLNASGDIQDPREVLGYLRLAQKGGAGNATKRYILDKLSKTIEHINRIFVETGWVYDFFDMEWRFELPDNRVVEIEKGIAKVFNDQLGDTIRQLADDYGEDYALGLIKQHFLAWYKKQVDSGTLPSKYTGAELFDEDALAALPELANISVEINTNLAQDDDGPMGSWDDYSKKIDVAIKPIASTVAFDEDGDLQLDEFANTIVHEVQHAIATLTGASSAIAELALSHNAKKRQPPLMKASLLAILKDALLLRKRGIDSIYASNHEENLALTAEQRAHLTDEERKQTPIGIFGSKDNADYYQFSSIPGRVGEATFDIPKPKGKGRFAISGIYTGAAADYARRLEDGTIENPPSLSYVNSGEGTQLEGWGLYGSSRRSIARWYAEEDVDRKSDDGSYYTEVYNRLQGVQNTGLRTLLLETLERAKGMGRGFMRRNLFGILDFQESSFEDLFEKAQRIAKAISKHRDMSSSQAQEVFSEADFGVTIDELNAFSWLGEAKRRLEDFGLANEAEMATEEETELIHKYFGKDDERPWWIFYAPYVDAVRNLQRDFNKARKIVKRISDEFLQAPADAFHEHVYEQTFFTNRPEGDMSHILDWDKPVPQEQREWIVAQILEDNKNQTRESVEELFNARNAFRSGEELYEFLSKVMRDFKTGESSPRSASRFLAKAGIDGVTYIGDSSGARNFVSFRDDNIRVDHKWRDGIQLFSIGNGTNGNASSAWEAFDDAMAMQRGGAYGALASEDGANILTQFGRMVHKKLANAQAPLYRAVNRVLKARGVTLPELDDALNVEAAFKNVHGKIRAKVDDIHRQFLEPLQDIIRENRLDVDRLNDYLYAKFAPERNKMIQARTLEVDPNTGELVAMDERGSGMSAEEASKIMQRFATDPKRKAYDKAMHLVWEMNAKASEMMVQYGLATQAQRETWRKLSPHYVPLRDLDSKHKTYGRGGSGLSAVTRRAKGRSTRAASPLEASIYQIQEIIKNGERSNANKTLAKFIHTYDAEGEVMGGRVLEVVGKSKKGIKEHTFMFVPNVSQAAEAIRSYNNQPQIKGTGQEIELVETEDSKRLGGKFVASNNVPEHLRVKLFVGKPDSDEVVEFFDNGVRKFILFDTDKEGVEEVVAAANGTRLWVPNAGSALEAPWQVVQKLTRYKADISTTLNPKFIMRNGIADFFNISMILMTEGKYGALANVTKNYAASMKTVRDFAKGKDISKTELGKYYLEARENGMLTGVYGEGNFKESSHKITRDIKRMEGNKLIKGWEGYKEFMETVGSYPEQGARLAVYAAMRKRGMSPAQAAQYGREVTVDFNAKGELTPFLNTLWMFSNAGAQGVARAIKAVQTGAEARGGGLQGYVRAVLPSILVSTALGFLSAMAMDASGDDDDEDKINASAYERLPDYVKQSNLTVPIGDTYIQLPTRGMWQPFTHLGTLLYDFHTGRKDSAEVVAGFTASMRDAADFIGGNAPTAGQWLAPTIADPFVQMLEGKDWAGRELYQRDYGQAQSQSSRGKYGTSNIYKWIAETLNEATGGNKIKSGLVDLHPETYKLFTEFFAGSLAQVITDAYGTTQMVLGGEGTVNQIPGIGGIWRQGSEFESLYYRYYGEFDKTAKLAEGYRREFEHAKSAEERRIWQNRWRELQKEYPWIKSVKQLRKIADKIHKDKKALAEHPNNTRLAKEIDASERTFVRFLQNNK